MTYFKATRSDATSFYDRITAWKVGRITRLPGELGTKLCGENVLHASTEPGESLVGGSWPCRLFVVEPRGKLLTSPRHPYKVGCGAWKVVEELPAWQALGPNGEYVAALIERTGRMTADEAERLDAAWAAARDAARDAAWAAVRDAAWAAVRDASWAAARDAAWAAGRDAAGYAVRDAAGYAAGYAAIALVVRDLISSEHFDTLMAPWKQVMG